MPTRYFAGFADGLPVSCCELYSRGGVGQVEDVATLEEHRGQGLASAAVLAAVDASRAEGHALTFLLADAGRLAVPPLRAPRLRDDRPALALPAAPGVSLEAIRLRTERLVLRLPTHEELVALGELAVAGIHPREEMPFGVAWTDDVAVESFVAFHEEARAAWRPDDWTLNLVTFLDGVPIGTQGMIGKDFAETREVSTGSWLGWRYQGRGYGTEQRAAVLELAFRGLGARAALSGALEGNVASARVSEKLGYRVVGTSTVSPRGVPVPHTDFRLDAADWSGYPAELEGVDRADFGL